MELYFLFQSPADSEISQIAQIFIDLLAKSGNGTRFKIIFDKWLEFAGRFKGEPVAGTGELKRTVELYAPRHVEAIRLLLNQLADFDPKLVYQVEKSVLDVFDQRLERTVEIQYELSKHLPRDIADMFTVEQLSQEDLMMTTDFLGILSWIKENARTFEDVEELILEDEPLVEVGKDGSFIDTGNERGHGDEALQPWHV